MDTNTVWIVNFTLGHTTYVTAANYAQALDGAHQYLIEQEAPGEIEVAEITNSRLTEEAFYA